MKITTNNLLKLINSAKSIGLQCIIVEESTPFGIALNNYIEDAFKVGATVIECNPKRIISYKTAKIFDFDFTFIVEKP